MVLMDFSINTRYHRAEKSSARPNAIVTAGYTLTSSG